MRQSHKKPLNYSIPKEKNVTGGHDHKVAENATFVATTATFPPRSEYAALRRKALKLDDAEAYMRQDDLAPIEEAAEFLGIEPKRLRGFIFRNKLPDPIGDMREVYPWSLRALHARLTNTSSVATSGAE